MLDRHLNPPVQEPDPEMLCPCCCEEAKWMDRHMIFICMQCDKTYDFDYKQKQNY